MGGDLSLAGSKVAQIPAVCPPRARARGPPRRKRRGPSPHEGHGGLAQAELMGARRLAARQ